jgi:hypothetical protein
MSNLNFSRILASLSILLLAAALPAQKNDATQTETAAPGASKVRIVRLSQVRGEVQIKHETDRAFESAMANLPIVEKTTLRVGTGVAEIEFEDNSTVRLGPDTMVEFPRLERLSTGATASSVHLTMGTAYVSLLKSPGNQFTLLFGDRKLDLPPSSHVRLQIEGSEAKLAVFDGNVHVDNATGAVDVSKKKTATFQLMDQSQPTIAKDIASSELDSWDHDAVGYHSRVASHSAFSSPYSYGTNDMAYYGSFIDAGGCGSMWRPYFASAAWDPFSNGAWAWYPGAGYSWVSPYPWGWTPYHYGNWSYCAGTGWGWMPGGAWNGLNNVAILNPPAGSGLVPPASGPRVGGSGLVPHPPVHSPRFGESTVTPVNLKPLVHSGISSPESFAFRKDSAGMGIPRDSLGRLDRFSRQADSHGVSSTQIYMTAPASTNGRMNNNFEHLGASIHRGPAPQPGFQEPMAGAPQGGMRGGSYNAPSNAGSGGSTQASPAMSAPSRPTAAPVSAGGGARPSHQ